jgi:hypothetical protein
MIGYPLLYHQSATKSPTTYLSECNKESNKKKRRMNIEFEPATGDLLVEFNGEKCVGCCEGIICEQHVPDAAAVLDPPFYDLLTKTGQDNTAQRLMCLLYGLIAKMIRPCVEDQARCVEIIQGIWHHPKEEQAVDLYVVLRTAIATGDATF